MHKIYSMLMSENSIRLVALSLLLIVFFQIVKLIIIRKISQKEEIRDIERVIYKKNAKTYLNVFLIILLIILWFSQLQAIFVSMFAVAAAIVIATKEMIMNFMGGVLIKMNNHFKLGDRIEVESIRGFVTDLGLTCTKILEIGPEKTSQQTTGSIVTIPNSVMLSKWVKNDSYFKGYSIKAFPLRIPNKVEVEDFEKVVLQWGDEISREYIKSAKENINRYCINEGILIPSADPRTKLVLGEDGDISIMLKIPVKNSNVGDVEQALLKKYLIYKTEQEANY